MSSLCSETFFFNNKGEIEKGKIQNNKINEKIKSFEGEDMHCEVFPDEIYNDYKMKLEKTNNITFGELFSSKYRNRMFIGISLCWVQQFSGINAVLFYSTKIFTGDKSEDEIDPFDDKMAKVFTILIGVILIISSWLSGLFIDKYGRKINFINW